MAQEQKEMTASRGEDFRLTAFAPVLLATLALALLPASPAHAAQKTRASSSSSQVAAANPKAPDFKRYCREKFPGSFVNSFRGTLEPLCTVRKSQYELLHHKIDIAEACRLTVGSTGYRKEGPGKYLCIPGSTAQAGAPAAAQAPAKQAPAPAAQVKQPAKQPGKTPAAPSEQAAKSAGQPDISKLKVWYPELNFLAERVGKANLICRWALWVCKVDQQYAYVDEFAAIGHAYENMLAAAETIRVAKPAQIGSGKPDTAGKKRENDLVQWLRWYGSIYRNRRDNDSGTCATRKRTDYARSCRSGPIAQHLAKAPSPDEHKTDWAWKSYQGMRAYLAAKYEGKRPVPLPKAVRGAALAAGLNLPPFAQLAPGAMLKAEADKGAAPGAEKGKAGEAEPEKAKAPPAAGKEKAAKGKAITKKEPGVGGKPFQPSVMSSTDPATGITTRVESHEDGSRTIIRFDRNGKELSRDTLPPPVRGAASGETTNPETGVKTRVERKPDGTMIVERTDRGGKTTTTRVDKHGTVIALGKPAPGTKSDGAPPKSAKGSGTGTTATRPQAKVGSGTGTVERPPKTPEKPGAGTAATPPQAKVGSGTGTVERPPKTPKRPGAGTAPKPQAKVGSGTGTVERPPKTPEKPGTGTGPKPPQVPTGPGTVERPPKTPEKPGTGTAPKPPQVPAGPDTVERSPKTPEKPGTGTAPKPPQVPTGPGTVDRQPKTPEKPGTGAAPKPPQVPTGPSTVERPPKTPEKPGTGTAPRAPQAPTGPGTAVAERCEEGAVRPLREVKKLWTLPDWASYIQFHVYFPEGGKTTHTLRGSKIRVLKYKPASSPKLDPLFQKLDDQFKRASGVLNRNSNDFITGYLPMRKKDQYYPLGKSMLDAAEDAQWAITPKRCFRFMAGIPFIQKHVTCTWTERCTNGKWVPHKKIDEGFGDRGFHRYDYGGVYKDGERAAAEARQCVHPGLHVLEPLKSLLHNHQVDFFHRLMTNERKYNEDKCAGNPLTAKGLPQTLEALEKTECVDEERLREYSNKTIAILRKNLDRLASMNDTQVVKLSKAITANSKLFIASFGYPKAGGHSTSVIGAGWEFVQESSGVDTEYQRRPPFVGALTSKRNDYRTFKGLNGALVARRSLVMDYDPEAYEALKQQYDKTVYQIFKDMDDALNRLAQVLRGFEQINHRCDLNTHHISLFISDMKKRLANYMQTRDDWIEKSFDAVSRLFVQTTETTHLEGKKRSSIAFRLKTLGVANKSGELWKDIEHFVTPHELDRKFTNYNNIGFQLRKKIAEILDGASDATTKYSEDFPKVLCSNCRRN